MRIRASFAAAMTAAVAALGGAAGAQPSVPGSAATVAIVAPDLPPAPFRVAPPGSVFQFGKTKVVVGKVDGFFASYTSNGTPRTTSLVASRDREQLTGDNLAEFSKIWPLTVGKSVHYHRYEARGGSRSWSDDVTVVGTETLQIGDKPIDTYLVRWNSKGDNRGNTWEATATNWYAPSLGWVVKLQGYDNYGTREDDHVVAYELAP